MTRMRGIFGWLIELQLEAKVDLEVEDRTERYPRFEIRLGSHRQILLLLLSLNNCRDSATTTVGRLGVAHAPPNFISSIVLYDVLTQ